MSSSYFPSWKKTLPESGLSNIALEWMLVEAGEKELRIDADEARKIVNDIPEPHVKDRHESLAGFWHVAEVWPKIVRVNIGGDGQSKWVSRIYLNFGRYRFLSVKNRNILHESVVQRLRERQDYRPKNVMRICGDVGAVPEKFEIEEWKRS